MNPHVRRKRCGATPPSVHLQPCDKHQGHDGPHRGYLSAVDVVEFWPNADDPPADEPVSVEAALALRRTRDEDEE